MPKHQGQKKKLIVLARILQERTDLQTGMTTAELMSALLEYGIGSERKSIYNDIETLRSLGYDIRLQRKGTECRYYLASRLFELAELKILVDAVQSSRFLPADQTSRLIEKLETLCSRRQAHVLQRQVYVANRPKSMNKSIYETIDVLHEAMSGGAQVSFFYMEWTAQKTLRRRRQERYVVSPYALIWQDECYYLLAYDSAAQGLRHYRVDKMEELCRLEEAPREGLEEFKKLNLAAYTNTTFGMFGGKTTSVTICFDASLAGVVIDRFGKEVMFLPRSEGKFAVTQDIVVSPQFMGWMAGLGTLAKIEAPVAVANAFAAHCIDLAAMYQSKANGAPI